MQHILTAARSVMRLAPRCLPAVNPQNYSAPSAHFCSIQKTCPTQPMLAPVSPLLNLVCGMKLKGRLRRRCKDCYFVVRSERLYVMCPTRPRHKQMSMVQRPKNTWILTHASQSKVRPW